MLQRLEPEADPEASPRDDDKTRSPVARRPGLGLIGAGAFGAFCVPHLRGRFDIHLADPRPELGEIAARLGVSAGDIETAAGQDIVVLAVPWRALTPLAGRIGPLLKPGALVVEVCSIKVQPLAVLADRLPATVDIVGTHPLFGPQSGRDGIAGLNVAVCTPPGRQGPRADRAARRVAGLLRSLGLSVIRTGADEHDRQMAYVQGLTHVIARAIAALDVPPLAMTTTTWQHLMRMAETVAGDSDELFHAITQDNPHAPAVRDRFAAALAGQTAGRNAREPVRRP